MRRRAWRSQSIHRFSHGAIRLLSFTSTDDAPCVMDMASCEAQPSERALHAAGSEVGCGMCDSQMVDKTGADDG